ncbi:MAG: transcriptional regulator, PadR family [Nocardioides sp.]|nr:transcriptional regulator, PadR family [Nocardioides sp.]
MTAHTTRLLLLGAVALFEPVNGYQIRRELVSWRVDKWAHLNPGSIYHGLTTLTGQGHLVRHDLLDGAREVAVYELTGEGRAELDRLMRSSLETVDPYDRVAFHAAFSMLPLLGRENAVACLEARRRALEETVEQFPDAATAKGDLGPPHAVRSLMLWRDMAVTELAWLRQTLHDIRVGSLRFDPDEDWGWRPPDDDPGWQMNIDREKYRALLNG